MTTTARADAAVLRRPVLVTAAVVVLYAGALVSVALGVLVLLSRYRVEPPAVTTVSLLGIGIVFAGLLMLAVAGAAGRGDRRARIAVTAWVGVLAALHVATIVVSDDFDVWSVVPLVLDAVVLVALWVPPSSRWFRRAPASA